jgi:protein-disulfide isomerase
MLYYSPMAWLRSFALFSLLALAPAPLCAEQRSPAELEQIQKVVRDYLSQHPEVIVDALKQYQDKQAAQQADKMRATIASLADDLLKDPGSPVGANLEGDVTVVEFFDYQCPYCKTVAPSLAKAAAADGKVRLVYKEFPILGAVSITAAKAALAAEQQGKYVAFHNKLFAQKGRLDDAAIFSIASDVGLDLARLKADMEKPQIKNEIDRNYRLADKLNIQGTPAFVIGQKLLPGAVSVDELAATIKQARVGD